MNDKFDELAKGMARSVTRRQALGKFALGVASAVLACFGLGDPTRAEAQSSGYTCWTYNCGMHICVPPGTRCRQTVSFNERGHLIRCKLSSATPVQDCTSCPYKGRERTQAEAFDEQQLNAKAKVVIISKRSV